MRELFDGVVPFVQTARHLSFRRAAEELGVTAAAVSKAVQRLESELGVELLHRTTRRVALSEEGALLLARCEEAIAQVQAGRDLVAGAQRVPRGELRVSLPFVIGRPLVAHLQRFFFARYPTLSLSLRLTDRKVRLVDESIDIAVRVGPLADSSLRSRRLADTRWVTVASPAYLARAGTPRTTADLGSHACIRFRAPRGKLVPWTFADGPCEPASTLDLDEGALILDAAVAGIGIAQVFDFMAVDALATGRLVRVLDDVAANGPSVYALYLPGRAHTPKVRAFLDVLPEAFSPQALFARP